MGELRRTQIMLPVEMYEVLRERAFSDRVSLSEVVRRALERYLKREGRNMAEGRVVVNGREVDFEAAVQLMDDDLREAVHADLAPCTEQEFVDEYLRRHREQFGVEFEVM